jgi:hypothetical protein
VQKRSSDAFDAGRLRTRNASKLQIACAGNISSQTATFQKLESRTLGPRKLSFHREKYAMVNAISGTSQTSQLVSSNSSSTSTSQTAALEKQIKAKEAEAEENEDTIKAATIAAELAALHAKLAKLQAAEKKSESVPESSSSASRQAEFDDDTATKKSEIWI